MPIQGRSSRSPNSWANDYVANLNANYHESLLQQYRYAMEPPKKQEPKIQFRRNANTLLWEVICKYDDQDVVLVTTETRGRASKIANYLNSDIEGRGVWGQGYITFSEGSITSYPV